MRAMGNMGKLQGSSRLRKLAVRAILCAAVVGCVCACLQSIAGAAEARPWLCRDKPVFSSDQRVHYEARSRGQRHWRLFFMQFVAGGPQDGFAVIKSDDIEAGSSRAAGELGKGQFFAVALYLAPGGRWVCPRSAEEAEEPRGPGVVSQLCYSDEESDSCRVRLTIRR
jgi:hypothetical protein